MMKFLAVLLLIALVVTAGLTYKRWEGAAPQVSFDHDFKVLGRNPALHISVQDPGTGLKHVAIHLKQKEQDIVLADENLNRDP